MSTVFYAAIVLGILIFVHELGHFAVAKWSGVVVEKFSIGFGPALLSRRKGETEYCIAAVPFGGYVKMLGEDSLEDIPPEFHDRTFLSQPLYKRFLIVAAGPLMNLLLAILLFFIVFALAGVTRLMPEVGEIQPGSPAEAAGLKKGDLIVRINETPVSSWEELADSISKWKPGNEPLKIVVLRSGEYLEFRVTPTFREIKNLFGEPVTRPVIGITASGKVELKKVGILKAAIQSIVQTIVVCKLFFVTVVKLIQRIIPFETLGGPILIAQMAGQQAQEGFFPFIAFMALISVNLAVINLLPFPALDGGHLLLFTIEAITGRRFHQKALEWIQKIGLAFLIILMIAVFYNDLVRIFPSLPDLVRNR
ncbi:RIP metalloprotease RseP [Thermodesulforhabdus norvegica]|uniref:Zinc metalloprotease n=1 Tax=Thermodesulforhabdus norvegica TaxID=39841 RepID=A0A1I4QML2_9BACT|nr:RIP metalloprotease RseP [Thermodesulforhabdus norvegica]SFM41281.1 site-2 protease. Metallo peptidase. MEROPS family M50B [Thermodesulforhabdus norvegica]